MIAHDELYGIAVEVDEIEDSDHTQITLTAATYLAFARDTADQYMDVEPHELASIAQHVAGLLGRLGTWAATYVEEQRQEHGCPSYVRRYMGPDERPSGLSQSCHIDCFDELFRPSISKYVDSPGIWLNVPTARAKHWLGLVHGWLNDLAAEQALTIAPATQSSDPTVVSMSRRRSAS